jgi:hypothetical protein
MITHDKHLTLVVFRKFKDDGSIIALFPEELWTTAGDCGSYMHVGQHSGADYRGVIAASKPATLEEYGPLLKELTSIGYLLKIRKRFQRRKAIK